MLKKLLRVLEVTLFIASILSYSAAFILFLLKYYYRIGILAPYDLSEVIVYLFVTGVITALIFNCIVPAIEGDEISFTFTAEDRERLKKLIDELD